MCKKCSICDAVSSDVIRLYGAATKDGKDIYMCKDCANSFVANPIIDTNKLKIDTPDELSSLSIITAEDEIKLLNEEIEKLKSENEALSRENFGLRQTVSNLKEKEEHRYRYVYENY